MNPTTIKAIFTNLLFVIGVILIVVGFTTGTLTFARSIIFEKYPLNSYEETRCEMELQSLKSAPVIEKQEPISKEEQDRRYETCKDSLEHDRKVRQVEDVVRSISFLFSGAVISFIFKRFIFKD